MTRDELKLLAKLDEMLVEMLEQLDLQGYDHGAGGGSKTAIKCVGWNQSVSDLPTDGAGDASGPSPIGSGCSRNDEGGNGGEREFAVMFVVQYATFLRRSELCNRMVGRSFVLSKNQARAVRRSSYLLWKKWRPRKRRGSTKAFCWTVIFQLTSCYLFRPC